MPLGGFKKGLIERPEEISPSFPGGPKEAGVGSTSTRRAGSKKKKKKSDEIGGRGESRAFPHLQSTKVSKKKCEDDDCLPICRLVRRVQMEPEKRRNS